MEVYQSKKTAEELEFALGAIPSIGENNHWFIGDVDTGVSAEGLTPFVGENGNWWVGETDTGVFAGGVKVEGAEVGQTIVVKAVDENGRSTEWESKSFHPSYADPVGWTKINEITITEEEQVLTVLFSTDSDGNPFLYDELLVLATEAKSTVGGVLKAWVNRDSPNASYYAAISNGLTTSAKNYQAFPFLRFKPLFCTLGDDAGPDTYRTITMCDVSFGNSMRVYGRCLNDALYVGDPNEMAESTSLELKKLYKLGVSVSATSAFISGTFTLYGRNYK